MDRRKLGEELGKGRTVAEITASTRQVAEGVKSCASIQELAARHQIEMPIVENVAAVVAGELTAAEMLGVPEYHVDESGPDHQKTFRATVHVAGESYGLGEGRSKKEAEQQAAESAWKAIKARSQAGTGAVEGASGGATGNGRG